jgi:anti-sigma factor RsiW
LRAEVAELGALRDAIRSEADYHLPSDALRRRIEAMATGGDVAAADATPPRRASPRPARAPWQAAAALWSGWGWRPLSAACAATVVLTLGTQMYVARDHRETRLADEVVASHVRSTLGEHLIDVASSDHHTVKPWLSSKLDFSPPVRDTDIGTAVFLGGRVDYLDGRPVAALVYRQGQHLVDAFVWPGDGDRAVTYTTERGYQIASWTRARMQHWVVSDVNRTEFVGLIERLAAPDEPAPAR